MVCFVQVSSDPPTWQGWIEVCALGLRLEGVCVVCRSIWLMISSCMFGRYSVLVQVFFLVFSNWQGRVIDFSPGLRQRKCFLCIFIGLVLESYVV